MDTSDGLGAEPPSSPRADDDSTTELGVFIVDGETFVVRRRNHDGTCDYGWLSGPNEGYGFSIAGGSEAPSREWHEATIRGFFRSIDPATGYV